MFTKSGKNLIRVTIPAKKQILPTNESFEEVKPLNGHVDSNIGDIVEFKCTIPPLEPVLTTYEETYKFESLKPEPAVECPPKKECLNEYLSFISKDCNEPKKTPGTTRTKRINSRWRQKEFLETLSKIRDIDPAPVVLPADNQTFQTPISKKIAITKPFKTELPSDDGDEEGDVLKTTSDSIIKTQPVETLPSPCDEKHLTPSNAAETIKNQTKYILYNPSKDPVQRERSVQAPDIKEKLEIAVQCDLDEDDDDSSTDESFPTDWRDEIDQEYEFIEDDNLYECHTCGEVCYSHSANYKHSLKHKNGSLLCFRCGLLFPQSAKLLAHEQKFHPDDNRVTKKTLRCPRTNCLKAFRTNRQLFEHIDQHLNRTCDQRCSKCQRLFATPMQLMSHIKRKVCWR